LIFKGATKLFCQRNIKVIILLDKALQRSPWGLKTYIFNKKKGIHCGYEDEAGMDIRFNVSYPLGLGRVTSKYIQIGDREGKSHPYSFPIYMPSGNIKWKDIGILSGTLSYLPRLKNFFGKFVELSLYKVTVGNPRCSLSKLLYGFRQR
jgi:hypothetical protein